MTGFDEYLYKYCLHDCLLNEILIQNDKMVFYFLSGIYETNPFGKEIKLTTRCRMVLEIEETDKERIFNHIEIIRILKKKVKDIDFKKFVVNLRQNKMDIDMNYYSRFCNTILIKGYINRDRYEMTISDVRKVEFLFI